MVLQPTLKFLPTTWPYPWNGIPGRQRWTPRLFCGIQHGRHADAPPPGDIFRLPPSAEAVAQGQYVQLSPTAPAGRAIHALAANFKNDAKRFSPSVANGNGAAEQMLRAAADMDKLPILGLSGHPRIQGQGMASPLRCSALTTVQIRCMGIRCSPLSLKLIPHPAVFPVR